MQLLQNNIINCKIYRIFNNGYLIEYSFFITDIGTTTHITTNIKLGMFGVRFEPENITHSNIATLIVETLKVIVQYKNAS